MTVYPATLLLIALWAILTLRDPDFGLLLAIALLPFGMFSAVQVGGLSLLAAHLVASLSLAVLVLRHYTASAEDRAIRLSPAGVAVVAFAIYGAFSAVLLVRLFMGDFLVFPVGLGAAGPEVSIHFPSSMAPVWPSSSNVSQLGYVLVACAYFLFLESLARRRGISLVEGALVAAATVNCVLGVLDFLEADQILATVRTADYALLNTQAVNGIPRIIGGYSEPAPFAALSAAFFAYFAMSFLIGRRPLHGALALGNLILATMALSTSGLVALGVGLLMIGLHLARAMAGGLPRGFALAILATGWLTISIVIAAALLTPLVGTVADVFDRLFLSKAMSLSGIERAAWARSGLETFTATYGLGAGIGSLRSNGLVPVLLGSVGVAGTLLFALVLWFSIGRPAPAVPEARRAYLSARVATLTVLTSAMLTATVPDPGLLMMTLAALASASWHLGQTERGRQRERSWGPGGQMQIGAAL